MERVDFRYQLMGEMVRKGIGYRHSNPALCGPPPSTARVDLARDWTEPDKCPPDHMIVSTNALRFYIPKGDRFCELHTLYEFYKEIGDDGRERWWLVWE